VDVLRTLARADGATGWIGMIGATTGSLAASVREDWAGRIWGADPTVITCGVTAPLGRARRVEGGLRVTGRWPFGSASRNARWICGGVTVVNADGEPVVDEAGQPECLLVLFDADDVRCHDNWHVSGLCGTGSGDIEVEDAFVPEGRWARVSGRPRVDTSLYRFPLFGLLALGVAAVSLGIGERALEALIELAGDKRPGGSRRTLAERGAVQADAARAEASLRSARALIGEAIDAAWDAAEAGERLTTTLRSDLRLAAVNATWAAVDAVDRCYHAAGGSAIYADSPLQRCFRDVHVSTQHVMVAPPVWELTGRVVLGRPPGGPL
jgi:alkylation response protein AidB-like acyl-CoA dehydrogenase